MTQDEYVSFCTTFIAKHGTGPKAEQVAKALGVSQSNAYQLLSDARKRGRITMAKKGDYASMRVIGTTSKPAGLAKPAPARRSRRAPALPRPSVVAGAPQQGTTLVVTREKLTALYSKLGDLHVLVREMLDGPPLFEALRQLVDRAAGDDVWRPSAPVIAPRELVQVQPRGRTPRTKPTATAAAAADDEDGGAGERVDEEPARKVEEPRAMMTSAFATSSGGRKNGSDAEVEVLEESEEDVDDDGTGDDDQEEEQLEEEPSSEREPARFRVENRIGEAISAHTTLDAALRAWAEPGAHSVVRISDGKVLEVNATPAPASPVPREPEGFAVEDRTRHVIATYASVDDAVRHLRRANGAHAVRNLLDDSVVEMKGGKVAFRVVDKKHATLSEHVEFQDACAAMKRNPAGHLVVSAATGAPMTQPKSAA